MNWFYWDTGWSLVFGTMAFMTVVSHPDSVVVDYHATDQGRIGKGLPNLRILMATVANSALTAYRRRNHAPDI
jgi:hypothetical protein